jgi:hypothetical protein
MAVRYSRASEDGCKLHPKHVELRIKKNKEYIKKYIYLNLDLNMYITKMYGTMNFNCPQDDYLAS